MAKTGMTTGKRPKGPALTENLAALAVPTKGQPTPGRQAVVVLAMHRTGSSAITRVLNLLGCDTAKTLMGPNEHNESGYWESDVLRVFNDKLLASGGSDWRDWQAFNPGWYQTPRFAEHLELGQELLKAEFGASKFFVFKDPRITRIVPFWRQLLAGAGVEPRVILTLRHPAEVAASLTKRDGMTGTEAALIWLRNMLEAEHNSRGLIRVVVSYDRLLAAPSATMAAVQKPLGLIWPRLSDKVASEIDAFMSPDLRHHKAELNRMTGLAFSDWLDSTYSVLRRWSETGEDAADWPALDEVRAAMDSLATPLREVVGVLTQQATYQAALDKEVSYLRGEAGKRGEAVTALTAEKQALSDELEALRGEAGKRGEAVTALTAEKQALSDELEALQAALQASQKQEVAASATAEKLTATAEEQASALAELARLYDTAETSFHELETALTTAETRSHTLVEELAQREAELATLQAEHSVLRSTLEQRTHELDETREDQVRSEAARRAESALNATLGAELEETKTELTRARSELADLRATTKGDGLELERRAAKVVELEKALASSTAELAERNRAMASQHQRLTILDETTTVQARELARLAQMTIEKEEALKRRNAAAHEAEARAAEHQRELADLQAKLEARAEDMAVIQADLEARLKALAESEGRVQELLNSTSWRITAPLRRFSLAFGRKR